MLLTLRIRDLAIIEDLVVEFGPGLNLLTGETGAGKSIVVDALSLVAGARADAGLVRSGAARATVDAVFALPPGAQLQELLELRGIDAPDGELVVRREVAAEGAGRAFVNGTPCALAVLRDVCGLLVELHGQHEQQSLLSLERHQELLDRFGGCEGLLAAAGEAHAAVLAAEAELAELLAAASSREETAASLARTLREIDAVSPRPGEHDALETERRILKNAGRMAELLDETVRALYDGEPSAAALATGAARRAAELAAIDPSLAELARRLDGARLELEDAGAALRDYRGSCDFDPARLEFVASRLAALDRLRLHHGPDEDAVLRAREEAQRELAGIESLDARRQEVESALHAARATYARAASALGASRRRAADALEKAVGEQLRRVALPKAQLTVTFPPSRGALVESEAGGGIPLHARGGERVEFLLAANPGEPPRPLSKVASGGELSRIMLALHGVLEGAGGGRVLIFDEVDAGVGGAVADAVGSRLSRLARRSQVLCVTHLPQVAAYADRHYHVRKRQIRGRTHAEVTPLDGEGRVDELARMLGGKEVTEASRRNATDLLEAASARPRAAERGGA